MTKTNIYCCFSVPLMNYLKENDIINEIKKETEKKSVNQFDELIEMEAK